MTAERDSHVLPILFGPTASGKSALGLALAHEFAGRGVRAEIITADAMQVYTGMDIGTAKPTAAERAAVPHHLLDVADPHAPDAFTVEDWLSRANALIDDLRRRGVVPIVVGGTSLYVQSLIMGMFQGPPADAALRERLSAADPAERRKRLEAVDPEAAQRIHPADVRRTIRALEVYELTGTPISALQKQWTGTPRPDARLYILSWPTETLNRRINARVKTMMTDGLLDEVKRLTAAGPLNRQASEALGYKQLIAHLRDPRRLSLDDAVERVKIETRRFAKNQRTWIRRMSVLPMAHTLDAAANTEPSAIAGAIADQVAM